MTARRTITDHEMQRRRLVAAAQSAVTDAMELFSRHTAELTPLEWLRVLAVINERVISEGLMWEWKSK